MLDFFSPFFFLNILTKFRTVVCFFGIISAPKNVEPGEQTDVTIVLEFNVLHKLV